MIRHASKWFSNHLYRLVLLWLFVPLAGTQGTKTHHSKPHLIEGDIILDKPVMKLIMASELKRMRRAVVKQTIRTWDNGIVPFGVSAEIDELTRISIRRAMAELQRYSCIRFKHRTTETDYVDFVQGDGCFSHIGRQGGPQILSVGPGCGTKEKVLHELMHCIGFFHEQSRYDRDLYVKILWWNIIPGAEKNFAVYSHGKIDTLGIPYDTSSITHYDNKAFSKNGGNTVEAIENPKKPLGETHLSKLDIKQVNMLYRCKGKREVTCVDRFQFCERLQGSLHLCNLWPKRIISRLCPLTCGFC